MTMTTAEARSQILAILTQIPTENLPKWVDKDECIWFPHLSSGWVNASHPERLARRRDQVVSA